MFDLVRMNIQANKVVFILPIYLAVNRNCYYTLVSCINAFQSWSLGPCVFCPAR